MIASLQSFLARLDYDAGALSCLVPWVVFALWRWWNVRRYEQAYLEARADAGKEPPSGAALPPAVIWSAVKDLALDYEKNLFSLLTQDYPDYTLVLSVESREDPAFPWFCRTFGIHPEATEGDSAALPRSALSGAGLNISSGLKEIRLVIAGLAVDEGQKVHNVLAASQQDGGYGTVIAMADADSCWPADGLRHLVRGALPEGIAYCTGYRWLVPRRSNMPSLIAASLNASVATLFGKSQFRSYAWAGAVAFRRDIFETSGLAERWRGSLNDDFHLSNVAREGQEAAFCPLTTPVNRVDYQWRSMANFVRRQYIQAWLYCRHLWVYAFLILVSYLSGWLIVLAGALSGMHWVWIPALMVYGIEVLRAGDRWRVVKRILPPGVAGCYRGVARCDRFLTPLLFLAHFILMLSSFAPLTMTWGGIRYRVKGGAVEILSRKPIAPHEG